MDKNVILGIGNILMQDEGFGVRVVEELARRHTFPDNVEVLDGGTLGMELMRFIKGADRLIIIDAVNGGGVPGDFYHFTKEEVKAYFKNWGFRTCWRHWNYWNSLCRKLLYWVFSRPLSMLVWN